MAEFILPVIIAFMPGLIWLLIFYFRDPHREPVRPVAKVFFLGMVITLPAVFLEFFLELFFPYNETTNPLVLMVGVFLLVAPIEEIAKYIVIRFTVFREKVFDEPIDGIVYSISTALGFATVENILSVIGGSGDILILRAVTATLLHALAGGLMGYCVGLAKFNPRNRKALLTKGVIIAIIFHGMYNFIIASNISPLIFLIAGLLLIMYVLLSVGIYKMRQS